MVNNIVLSKQQDFIYVCNDGIKIPSELKIYSYPELTLVDDVAKKLDIQK